MVEARKQGENLLARNRQCSGEIEAAQSGARQNIVRHKGHQLPDGSRGLPHYQTPGKPGHTFWKGIVFVGGLLDPFDAISGELARDEDYMKDE